MVNDMTVKELIEKLKEFPEDMRVVDTQYDEVVEIYNGTLTRTIFGQPEKVVVLY